MCAEGIRMTFDLKKNQAGVQGRIPVAAALVALVETLEVDDLHI